MTVKEDFKLGENLLRVIAEYTSQPFYMVQNIYTECRSFDQTILICLNADKYKIDSIGLCVAYKNMLLLGEVK